MSDRERWIVYPLLFYALIMGLKSTYRDPMEFRCRTIDCQYLRVKSINGADARAIPLARNATNVIVVREEEPGQGAGVTSTSEAPPAVAAEVGATEE